MHSTRPLKVVTCERWPGIHSQTREKRGKQNDEQTEKASFPAFTQAGKHRAVPFAICDVALLDAVLCG